MKLPLWTPGLRVLSVRQPFASAILIGGKDVENRPQPAPAAPFWCVVHAGLQWYGKSQRAPAVRAVLRDVRYLWPEAPEPSGFERGAALGIVYVSGSYLHESIGPDDRSLWASGPHCWRLSYPIVFRAPVPCAGKLGLFAPPIAVSQVAQEAYAGAGGRL